MPRCVADPAKRVVAVLLAAALVLMGSPAAFADTNVDAVICDPNGASVTLYSPQPGTVVGRPEVTVSGVTSQASMVTFYVDGQYDGSVAIPRGSHDFTLTMQLTSGMHRIRVEANDSCQISNGEAEAQVEYAPPAEVAGQEQPGEVSAPGEAAATLPLTARHDVPLPQRVSDMVTGLALPPLKALDIVPRQSTHIPPKAAARFVGAISTCTLAVFGWPGLVRRLFTIGPCASLSSASKNAWMPRLQFGIRLAAIGGFLLLVLL